MRTRRQCLLAGLTVAWAGLILACGGMDPAASSSNPVTRANYNKIKNDMTLAEVTAILGPGTENAQVPGAYVMTWQSDSLLQPTIISITFQNDRVQSKAITP